MNKICFHFQEPVRFPFYVGDPIQDMKSDVCGITMYLNHELALVSKQVQVELDDAMALAVRLDTLRGSIVAAPEAAGMQIDASDVLSCDKHIYMDGLHGDIGISGLYDERLVTLGELDPLTLADLDPLSIMMRKFGSIPAHLNKEITVAQTSALRSNRLTVSLETAAG